jgi:hypothetical protein
MSHSPVTSSRGSDDLNVDRVCKGYAKEWRIHSLGKVVSSVVIVSYLFISIVPF